MRILYPSLPYEPRTIDPLWEPEYSWARQQGFTAELFDVETEQIVPRSATPEPALYRGWMLSAGEYESLAALTPLLVSPTDYLASHQASGWYEAIAEFTFPSTFQPAAQLPDFAAGQRYFVKGLVKSFGVDSVVSSAEQWRALLARHEIPAAETLFVRRFAELEPDSEQRFFVVAGVAYGAAGTGLPAALAPVLSRLKKHKFYSLDVARTIPGGSVVVEVGDGQVSDLKEWKLADFGATVLGALAAATKARS